MERVEHTALVGVKILSSRGLFHLRQLVRTLQREGEIERLSSIYKVGAPDERRGLTDQGNTPQGFFFLSLVLKVLTTHSVDEFFQLLRTTENEWQEGVTRRATTIHLYLLSFDNTTIMTPELTLPYPDLHRTPELLIPAAEIWGDHIHSVLNESLFTLTQAMKSHRWGEFYAQGKSLLDF